MTNHVFALVLKLAITTFDCLGFRYLTYTGSSLLTDKSQTESLPYFQDLSYPQKRTVRRVASYELL